MKLRKGFVSNSSSSSFILDTDYLTDKQILYITSYVEYIENHSEAKEYLGDEMNYIDSPWDIEHDKEKKELVCYTSMDNFNLMKFFKYLNLPLRSIKEIDHRG